MNTIKFYIRRSTGSLSWSNFFYFFISEFYFILFKNLYGSLGILCRSLLFPFLAKKCSRSIVMLDSVSIRGFRKFFLEKNISIDTSVLLDAHYESKGIYIHKNVEIHKNVILSTGQGEKGEIKIQENSKIGPNVCIYGNGGVEIGKNVLIAGNCLIVASSHNFEKINIPIINQGFSSVGIKIGDDVWIGANSVILDGVNIGKGSIIGSSSVVNSDIPNFSIAVGSPAKVIRTR